MSIEAGARIGMIAPDDTTYEFLDGRRHAPQGADWDKALAYWATLPTDAGAQFDRELSFDAAQLAPMVSWGTSPEDCAPVNGVVPDPAGIDDGDRRRHRRKPKGCTRFSSPPVSGGAIPAARCATARTVN